MWFVKGFEKLAISGKWINQRTFSGISKRMGVSPDKAMDMERSIGKQVGYSADKVRAKVDTISSLKKFHGDDYGKVRDTVKRSIRAYYPKERTSTHSPEPKKKLDRREGPKPLLPYTERPVPDMNPTGQYLLFSKRPKKFKKEGFVVGLSKIAAFTAHNDGTEFKIQDTEPAPYVAGAGGMAPSGIPSYRPTENKGIVKPKWGPELSGKQAEKKRALDIAMLGKMASDGDPRDSGAYVGSAGQTAGTTASQLKYETTTDNITEKMGYNKPSQQSRLNRNLKQLYKGARK